MQVRNASQSDYSTLELIANEILAPLYGDQKMYLNQWLTGDGYKHAFLFFDNDNKPIGFLNLKRNPNKSYLKIAALLILPAHQSKGYGAILLDFAQKHAMEWYFECMIVTVSEEKPESLSFFLKNGFQIINSLPGKYKPNITEFVLKKSVEPLKDLRMKSLYLKMIQDGTKPLECRANHKHVLSIRAGEKICIFNQKCNQSILARIVDLRRYSTIARMLELEDYNLLIPGFKNSDEVLREYRKFYPDEKIQRTGGVTVFEIQVMK
jgi:ASC-1-like (ASCH) protein/N-acetylglutamate synthase-like GNAT family acetyltransferase